MCLFPPGLLVRLLVLVLSVAASAGAQPARPADAPDLVVAVYDAPPFVAEEADGTWSGLGVAFVQQVGQQLNRGVRFVGVEADSLGAALAQGQADLAIASTTADGEDAFDYSAPFVSARLGVARPAADRLGDIAGRFFSPTFFKIAAGISALLLLVGVAVWAFERHEEGDDFREGTAGIWDGFWWSGVTMTTIGYGDTVPASVGGRTLALTWMLVSMALTAALTTALVAALGLGEGAASGVRLPDDLEGERVGVVEGSAAAALLREAGLAPRPFPTAAAGLAAIEADSLDAFAGAVPRLQAAQSSGSTLRIASTGVEFERWALAVGEGSALREPVARAALDRLHSADWPETVRRHTE